jgi:hypothetical protein
MDKLDTVILHSQATETFNRFVLPLVQQGMEQDGEPDYVARSEAWNNWTDSLCKDGQISDWQYANWSQPASCGD